MGFIRDILYSRRTADIILLTYNRISKATLLKKLMSINVVVAVYIGILIILVGFGYIHPQNRLYVASRVAELQGIFSINTYPLQYRTLWILHDSGNFSDIGAHR
jgi:hypothetical protein